MFVFRELQDIQEALRKNWSLSKIYETLLHSPLLLSHAQSFPEYSKLGALENKAADILFSRYALPNETIDQKTLEEIVAIGPRYLSIFIPTFTAPLGTLLASWHGNTLSVRGEFSANSHFVHFLQSWMGSSLFFDELSSLESETARILCESWNREYLSFDTLSTLKRKIAHFLGQWCSVHKLSLGGLSENLSPKTLRSLSYFKGTELHLNGLSQIDKEQAKALAQFCGPQLHLNGLLHLEKDVLEELVAFSGETISLNNLKELDPSLIFLFQNWKVSHTTYGYEYWNSYAYDDFALGILCLNGLTHLSYESAEAFASWEGARLELNSLRSLESETLKALLQFKGELSLNGLLPENIVSQLSDPLNWEKKVEYEGEISISQALILSHQKIHFEPKEPTSLLQQVLSQWNQEELLLEHHLELEKNIAFLLSKFPGNTISLKGLTSLQEESASFLFSWSPRDEMEKPRGALNLDGLKELPEEIALLLNYWKGQSLSLNQLPELSQETAFLLASWKGSALSLNGLENPSIQILKILSQFQGDKLSLRKIRSVNMEKAKALMPFPGALDLGGLKGKNFLEHVFRSREEDTLELQTLKKLDRDQAFLLSYFKGSYIYLNKLQDLPIDVAKVLLRWNNPHNTSLDSYQLSNGKCLCLNGLRQLSKELATLFSDWEGRNLF